MTLKFPKYHHILQIWFASSVGIALSTGVYLLMTSLYLVFVTPISSTFGVDGLTWICYFHLAIGATMTSISLMGCFLFDSSKVMNLRWFIVCTGALCAAQFLVGTWVLHQVSNMEALQCRSSQDDTSLACQEFRNSSSWRNGYSTWQRVWIQATQPDYSDSAGELLQTIQDTNKCCGYGQYSQCRHQSEVTLHPSELFGSVLPERNCSLVPGNETSYCEHVAENSGILYSNCSHLTDWDFPYGGNGQGNTGRCLNMDMISKEGCAVHWTIYAYSKIKSLGILWIILSLLQINCPLSAYCVMHSTPRISNPPQTISYPSSSKEDDKLLGSAYLVKV